METKQCDKCKDVVDDYNNTGGKDFGECKEEIMCIDCIQEYKEEDPYDWEVAEKSWKDSTIIEKAYFTKEGNIHGSVVIFTDTKVAPEWKDISETNQWVLLNVMGDIIN